MKLLLLFFSVDTRAQARQEINGIVFDKESGMPLSGAHVLIVGTSYGTITGPDGSFRFFIKDFPVNLKVSHIGYEDRYFTVDEDIKDEALAAGADAFLVKGCSADELIHEIKK